MDNKLKELVKKSGLPVFRCKEALNNTDNNTEEAWKLLKEKYMPYNSTGELSKKKIYRFEYIKEDVMKWSEEVRKTMTKQMLYMLPLRVTMPYIMPDEPIIPATDFYGDPIDDYDEWKRQREEYIENLYNELKSTNENDD